MADRPELMDRREQRLNDVLGAYLEMEDAGLAPDRRAWLSHYPEFKSDLEAFFVAQSRVAALAYPCSAHAQGQGKDADVASDSNEETAHRPPGHSGADGDDVTSVGDYELVELINEGGMGKVYKAKLKWTDSWVALKKIKAGRLATRSEVRRFLEEVRSAASLHHANIVPIYHAGEHDGQPFFTMKLFEHGSLQQHLPRYEQDHAAAAELLAKVARAVHYAHQRGILHRDLKPANILLDAQGQPYVADFGLAKRLRWAPAEANRLPAAPAVKMPASPTIMEKHTDPGPDAEPDVRHLAPAQAGQTQPLDGEPNTQNHTVTNGNVDAHAGGRTRVGAFIGTKGYIPPEHAELSKDGTSTAADVYSLGAILYKMLTGKTLFDSAATLADAVRQVKECVPEPPHTLNPHTDERLEAICMKCLRKNPQERYASAELLAEDLERWLRGEPPLAWPLPWHLRAWGAVRPYLLVAFLAACAGISAAAIFFVYYYFDPNRIPRTLEEEAKRGPLTLIGETGLPRWSRWSIGEGMVMVGPENDQPFSFTTVESGRLDLLAKAPGPRYRFSAQIRHERAIGDSGSVGIYFGHAEDQTEDGPVHYWWDLGFADLGIQARMRTGPDPTRKYGEVMLIPLRRDGLPLRSAERLTEVRSLFLSAAETWRSLAVEVSPEKIRFFWEGESFGELTTDELRKHGETWKGGNEIVMREVKFKPDGAVGIFVSSGKASFRNVKIEPME